MPTPIRLLIHGASGRMGRALLRLASQDARFDVVAAISRGTPLSDATPDFDVAIDFSLPEGFERIRAWCAERGRALVSGTTGLDAVPDDVDFPFVWASNFSLGVAVLAELVKRASAALPGWDIDIVESHHVHKRDAPSGTALTLGAASGRGDVSYASLRAGDIVGEHTVQFTGLGERLELVHRATHRDLFARGALEAAARLFGKAPGRHALAELLLD